MQKLISEVLDETLFRTWVFKIITFQQLYPRLWNAIHGFLPVESFLGQEKLLMAACIFVGDYKECQNFRGLLNEK